MASYDMYTQHQHGNAFSASFSTQNHGLDYQYGTDLSGAGYLCSADIAGSLFSVSPGDNSFGIFPVDGTNQWDGSDSNASVLGEYTYLQADSASQYGYDREPYLGSPQSEVSHDFETMSSIMNMNLHHTPGADTPPSSEEGQDESDDILDNYLRDVEPREDRLYYCEDVRAEDHSCHFVHERRCMLRKHLEQTLKTNVCNHPTCKGQAFSSKAVLTRHEREAHGMHQATQYFCPDRSCERANRGFAREYNMADHIARVHKELDPNQFLKKTKRVKKGQSGAASSVVSSGSTVVEAKAARRGSGKPRRQAQHQQQQLHQLHFERFQAHQENGSGLWAQIHDPRSPNNLKVIQQLRSELGCLEDAYLAIHGNGGAGND